MTTPNTWEERFESIFTLGGGGTGQVCMLEEVYKERVAKGRFLVSLAVQEERERVINIVKEVARVDTGSNGRFNACSETLAKLQELKSNEK